MIQEFIHAIVKTESTYRQAIQRKTREKGINLSFETLSVIKQLIKYKEINQQELANIMHRDKSSLSYLINNMERKGLIVRKEDAKDKRNKLVKLTRKGHDVYKELEPLVEEVYSSIDEDIDTEHINLCITYMNEFNTVLKQS